MTNQIIDQLTAAEKAFAAVLDGMPAELPEVPTSQVLWPVATEVDAMAVGFEVARLRDRAARAKELCKAIERECERAEQRIMRAVGGGIFREGDKEREDWGDLQKWVAANTRRGTKSVTLPCGRFGFRAATASVYIDSIKEKELIEVAEAEHPEWLDVKVSINRAALKASIEATGDLPMGKDGSPLAEFFPAGRRDNFYFTPTAGAAEIPGSGPAHPPVVVDREEA